MRTRLILYIAALIMHFVFHDCNAQANLKTIKPVINPTGFYKLNGVQKKDETYGYFGEVKVKLIRGSRIVISFFICKGYPSYNSGSFYDTLNYSGNAAVYKYPDDPSCRIDISFTATGVKVDEKTDNYNSGCGFGHAVVAKDFFRKRSSRVPSNKELEEE